LYRSVIVELTNPDVVFNHKFVCGLQWNLDLIDFSCHVHNEYTVAILRNILPCFQARGIDIPMLDNVVNYNFPAKPKLFVHRV